MDELIISKIQSSVERQDTAKRLVDIDDAQKLLEEYPKTIFKTDKHRQIIDNFRREHNLPWQPNTPSIKPEKPGAPVLCRRGDLDCVGVPKKNVAATPEELAIAERAGKVSSQEFDKLTTEKLGRLPKAWIENGVNSVKDVRTKMLGYKPLEPSSPKLRPGGGVSVKGLITKGAGAAGAALWASSVSQAFLTNTTALDRAAAITSIIPIIGCAVNTAAAVQHNKDTGLVVADTVLCGIADVLLLTPLAPIGFILHLFRAILDLFQFPPSLPTLVELQQMRNKEWDTVLVRVFQYIMSRPGVNEAGPFALTLESALKIDAISVLSEAADMIGVLNASSSADLNGIKSDPELDLAKLESGSREASERIRSDIDKVIARRHRQYLLGIPIMFANGSALSLKKMAKDFDGEFIAKINSDEFIQNYPEVVDFFTKACVENCDTIARIKESVGYLQTRPPPLPSLLDVAFVLGQSMGLEGIYPDTLSPFSFFDLEVTEASKVEISSKYRHTVVIQHTIDVIRVIQGRFKEEQLLLHDYFPVADAELLKNFRLLIAMRLGKLYQDTYTERNAPYLNDSLFYLEETLRKISTPYIPPIAEHPNNTLLVSLTLGLTGTGLEEHGVIDGDETSYLKQETGRLRKLSEQH